MTLTLGAPILVIKPEWLKMILEGQKTLEIRSNACKKEIGTTIFFSPSKSGKITGCATFDGCFRVDTDVNWTLLHDSHCVSGPRPYRNTHAWRFKDAIPLDPIPYKVRPGTVVWRKYYPI